MAAKPKSSGPRDIEAVVSTINRVLVLLVLAVLVISVCFNVYLLFENSVLKKSVTEYARLRQERIVYQEMQQVVQRMVGEMAQISRTDKGVRGILVKYWRPLSRYGLDAQTGPTVPKPNER